jgi:hypothetical protein
MQALRRSQMLNPAKDMIDTVAAASRERDSIVTALARDISQVAKAVEDIGRFVPAVMGMRCRGIRALSTASSMATSIPTSASTIR